MWKISKTQGWGLQGRCSVSSELCCESQLQGSPVAAGSLQKGGAVGVTPALPSRGCQGRRGAWQEDSPRSWRWRAEHTSCWLGRARQHRSFWHPSDLLKSPKNLKNNRLLSWLVFCLFLTAVSPIVLLPLTPFSCMEQKPTRLLLGLCLRWQMWDGWCSRRCPGLKWVNLNRFRVWMLLWQMSSTIIAISFWKTGLEMSQKMWGFCFNVFPFFLSCQKEKKGEIEGFNILEGVGEILKTITFVEFHICQCQLENGRKNSIFDIGCRFVGKLHRASLKIVRR